MSDQDDSTVDLSTEPVSPPGQPGPTHRPALSLSEAERAGSGSRSTLKRALAQGELPNSYREIRPDGLKGRWMLPVNDLIQAGYPPNRYDGQFDPGSRQGHGPGHSPTRKLDLQSRLNQISAELDLARNDATHWRGRAEERTERIEELKTMLNDARSDMDALKRMLPPGPAPVGESETAAKTSIAMPASSPEPPPKRRRWWGRAR